MTQRTESNGSAPTAARTKILGVGTLVAVILLLAALAASVMVRSSVPDPTCQKRRLSDWLTDYDKLGPTATFAEVNAAVRQLGTNALPELISLMRAKDSAWLCWLLNSAERHHVPRPPLANAERRHSRALAAFRALGPAAEPALPALAASVRHDNFGWVLSAVAGLGLEGCPVLLSCLTNAEAPIRAYAAALLGLSQCDPAVVVPALCARLGDPDSDVRHQVARTLAGMASSRDLAVPALVQALRREGNNKAKEALVFALLQLAPSDSSAREAVAMAYGTDNKELDSLIRRYLGQWRPPLPAAGRENP